MIYPAEICEVLPGQFFREKIPEELQGKVVLDFATRRPSQRLDLIRKGIDARGASANCPTPVNPVASSFPLKLPNNVLLCQIMEYTPSKAMLNAGMQVSPDPVSVPGRLLPTPKIAFGGQEIVRLI